jgi:hypothetical protein
MRETQITVSIFGIVADRPELVKNDYNSGYKLTSSWFSILKAIRTSFPDPAGGYL